MLASVLVLLTLGQAEAPPPFLWRIEGLGYSKSVTLVVTISPTPFGLANGLAVKSVSLAPLPTREDPKPGAIWPLSTEPAATEGLRARFAPPGRRFHVVVTLSDGSTHTIDIYQKTPPTPAPEPEREVKPLRLIAPQVIWTANRSRTLRFRFGRRFDHRSVRETRPADGRDILRPIRLDRGAHVRQEQGSCR